MASQLSPFVEANYGWPFGSSGWNNEMDQNLVKFSYLHDRNIDAIVSSLPAISNGNAYFNTSDNRLYFDVNGQRYSSVIPKWFEVTLRSTGQIYQFDGSTLTAKAPALLDYIALRAYTGNASQVEITKKGITGPFRSLGVVGGYVDNGGTYIIGTDLRVWERIYTGPVNLWWFDCPLDGVTNADAAFAKFTAAVKNGEALIPPIKYVATSINFTLVGQGPTIGGLTVYASGATIVGECAITVDSCKRLRIDGLEGWQTDLKLNGAWYFRGNGLKLRDIIFGESNGVQFSSNYWGSFGDGCQFQSIITSPTATNPSNKFSWDNCTFRGDAAQGYLTTRDYFIKFMANQNAQSWAFTNCDISYFVIDVLFIDPSNIQDVELFFDWCYFDTKYPKLASRAKTRLVVDDAHAANDQPNSTPISQAFRGDRDAWRGDRSAGLKSHTLVNLIPNGDFYDRVQSYVGAGLPIGSSNSATITPKTGAGPNGTYLTVTQALTTANQVRFRSRAVPFTGKYTGVMVMRNADVGAKTVRLSIGGLSFDANLTDTEWSVATLTTALDLAAGSVNDIILSTIDGTAYNVDVCYAGFFAGEAGGLFPASARLQNIYGSLAAYNPAAIAAGAESPAQSISVPGAAVGDFCTASFTVPLQGMQIFASCEVVDTVSVKIRNGTAAPIDLGSGTLRVKVEKYTY